MENHQELRMVTPKQAAQIYGLKVGTLANWRCQRRGPRYFKVNRKVYYKIADLEAWLFRRPVKTLDTYEDDL